MTGPTKTSDVMGECSICEHSLSDHRAESFKKVNEPGHYVPALTCRRDGCMCWSEIIQKRQGMDADKFATAIDHLQQARDAFIEANHGRPSGWSRKLDTQIERAAAIQDSMQQKWAKP